MEIVYYNRVRRYGGSHVIAIPTQLRKMLNLRQGDFVKICLRGEDKLVFEKATPDFSERKIK